MATREAGSPYRGKKGPARGVGEWRGVLTVAFPKHAPKFLPSLTDLVSNTPLTPPLPPNRVCEEGRCGGDGGIFLKTKRGYPLTPHEPHPNPLRRSSASTSSKRTRERTRNESPSSLPVSRATSRPVRAPPSRDYSSGLELARASLRATSGECGATGRGGTGDRASGLDERRPQSPL